MIAKGGPWDRQQRHLLSHVDSRKYAVLKRPVQFGGKAASHSPDVRRSSGPRQAQSAASDGCPLPTRS